MPSTLNRQRPESARLCLLAATAASWLCGGAADASVVRTPGTFTLLSQGDPITIDLNANGFNDFTLQYTNRATSTTPANFAFRAAGTGGETGGGRTVGIKLVGAFSPQSPVKRYDEGDTIEVGTSDIPSADFQQGMLFDEPAKFYYGVTLQNRSIGYFSLAYDFRATRNANDTGSVTISDLTYESVPDTALTIAVPEPTSLAALAAGAAAVGLRRTRPMQS